MSTTTVVALDPNKLYEIVDGQPEEKERHGARHSGICTRLMIKLGMYLKANRLGELYPVTSFQIGVNERIPDLAFVSAAHIPPEGEPDTNGIKHGSSGPWRSPLSEVARKRCPRALQMPMNQQQNQGGNRRRGECEAAAWRNPRQFSGARD